MPRTPSHRIERTRNRHSRAVLRDDTVVIRLAKNLSATEEREHVENLLKRMTRIVHRERHKRSINPFRPLLEGENNLTMRLANGTMYSFTLSPASRTKAHRTRDGWHIDIGPHTRRSSLHRLLWSLIADRELSRVTKLVHFINGRSLQEHIRDVRLTYTTSQWGSCSRYGDICLSTALLFVPEPLLHYVITHELAHRIHPNHSRAYWRTVEGIFPDYKRARRALHNFKLNAL